MNLPKKNQKIIGTLIQLSALKSTNIPRNENGSISAGLIFLDWLKKTRQSAWQMLPLHETQLELGSITKHVPSPYKSYGIGLDPRYLPQSHSGIFPSKSEKKEFIENEKDWILDYSIFCALRDHFRTDDWRTWDEGLKNREEKTLTFWRRRLAKEIDNYIILQWQLHNAYSFLRIKAKKLQIILIGDLSYYVSLQSPLVWANQEIFQIQNNGALQFVTGIPDSPDAHFGRQIWGHPLYNWKKEEKVIKFWEMRLRYQAKLFDQIRLDHAKALFKYGRIDISDSKNDIYLKGPGQNIFKKIISICAELKLSIFAEDSGENINDLRITLKQFNIPGIYIFRFALMEKTNKLNTLYADIKQYRNNSVAYTTTHDTETLLGYLNLLSVKQKQFLARSANILYSQDNKIFAENIRESIINSPAGTVIIPIQDWLLTTDRINIPGTELPFNDPNWKFQLEIPIELLPVNL